MKKPLVKTLRLFLWLFLISFLSLFVFYTMMTAHLSVAAGAPSLGFFSGAIYVLTNIAWAGILLGIVNFLVNPLVLIVLLVLIIFIIIWYSINVAKRAKFISYLLPVPFLLSVLMALVAFMNKDEIIARVGGNWPDPLPTAVNPAINYTHQAIAVFTIAFLAITLILGFVLGIVGFIGTAAAPSKAKQLEKAKEEEAAKAEEEAVKAEEEAAKVADVEAEKALVAQPDENDKVRLMIREEIAKAIGGSHSSGIGAQTINGSPITINVNNNFPAYPGPNALPVTTVEQKTAEPAPVEPVKEPEPVAEVAPVEEAVVEETPAVEEAKAEEPSVVVVEQEPAQAQPTEVEPVVAPVEPDQASEDGDEEEGDGSGKTVIRRVPFSERVPELEDDIKAKYSELKNYCLAYGIKSRISNSGDTFRLHRKTYVKITVAGKGLKLYFALDPKDYVDSKTPVKDVGSKNLYAEIPAMFKVKSDLSVKRAKMLIDDVCLGDGLDLGEVEDYDWSQDFEQSADDGSDE